MHRLVFSAACIRNRQVLYPRRIRNLMFFCAFFFCRLFLVVTDCLERFRTRPLRIDIWNGFDLSFSAWREFGELNSEVFAKSLSVQWLNYGRSME